VRRGRASPTAIRKPRLTLNVYGQKIHLRLFLNRDFRNRIMLHTEEYVGAQAENIYLGLLIYSYADFMQRNVAQRVHMVFQCSAEAA
jgi:hypothetical protein